MPATAARRPTSAWCYQEVWERLPISPDQYTPLPPDARYGLCVVGDALDAVFAAMSDETEGRRLDGRDDAVLRQTLQTLPPGRTWYLVSVVDNGDEGPDALAKAVTGIRHVAEAVIDVCPSLAGWRILVRGAAMRPVTVGESTDGAATDSETIAISPVARAVTAAALVLRTELECDVRVVDYLAIPAGKDRLLMELVRGTEEVVAVRGDERLVPRFRELRRSRPDRSMRARASCELQVSPECAV